MCVVGSASFGCKFLISMNVYLFSVAMPAPHESLRTGCKFFQQITSPKFDVSRQQLDIKGQHICPLFLSQVLFLLFFKRNSPILIADFLPALAQSGEEL